MAHKSTATTPNYHVNCIAPINQRNHSLWHTLCIAENNHRQTIDAEGAFSACKSHPQPTQISTKLAVHILSKARIHILVALKHPCHEVRSSILILKDQIKTRTICATFSLHLKIQA